MEEISSSRWNLSRWAIEHRAFTAFALILILVAGTRAYFTLGRAEDPSFKIKTAIVSAQWPGATAAEMQNQVADRIESKLRQLPYLDFLRTYCLPNRVLIMVQLRDNIPKSQVDEIWYQTRKKLDDLRPSLPPTLLGPNVNDEYGDVYSAIYAFQGDGYTPGELKKICETARKRVLLLQEVEKVDLLGNQGEKIFVEFSQEKLNSLAISPNDLFDALRNHNDLRSAGSIDTTNDRIYLRLDKSLCSEDRVRNVPIDVGGRTFTLGDIASVSRGYDDPPDTLMRYNGRPAIGIGVVMADNENVLSLGENVTKTMQAFQAELPAGVDMGVIAFQPKIVEESVTEFLRSFAEALVIVLLVSFLSLGFRTGVVVAVSVPVVLAIVFVVMEMMGMDFDRISLGALILALGLLVDDAIIAIEMMSVKLEEGWDRASAATYTWQSTAFPMLSGTLITAAGFLPVGIAKSAAGEYAGGIFWVVGIALVTSWFVAVIFIPYLGILLLPDLHTTSNRKPLLARVASRFLRRTVEPEETAKTDPDVKEPHFEHASQAYNRPFHRLMRGFITICVSRPYLVVGTTLIAFIAAVVGFTTLQQQFFPTSSRLEVLVDLRLPEGSSIEATQRLTHRMEEHLEALQKTHPDDPYFEHYTSYIGIGAARFFLALNPDLPDPSFAKIVIVSKDLVKREELVAKISETLQSDPEFSIARCRVNRLEFGPPVGFPVQFRVTGDDESTLNRIAYQVLDVMKDDPAMIDPHIDVGEQAKSIDMQLDHRRLAAMKLSPQRVADTMQAMLTGVSVTQVREGTELVDIVVRASEEDRSNPATIGDLMVRSDSGASLSLNQVARITPVQEPPILWRRNQESLLTVRGDVVDGVQPPDVSNRIYAQLAEIRSQLPPGYRIEQGGGVEESAKANKALFAVFPVMIMVMLTLLMLQVQNFRKALLVFGIAPLGIIGATLFLHLFNAPFGFVAMLGVIALAGMDMRNSVILIDQIEQDMASGLSQWEAVIESSVRRARPVVLTAATAILAMIPLTRSVFWGPMAIAIMGGLSLATFLTLLNLPALYVILFRVKKDQSAVSEVAG
jgi:multidrug efflux pump subunit AcrB